MGSIESLSTSGRQASFVDRYVPALLTQAAHLLVGEFADTIRDRGLSVLEWRVLATLGDGRLVPVGLLARRAVTKQPTLTRLLDRMGQQGLIDRVPAQNDRRQTLVCITPAGRDVVQELMQFAEERQASLTSFIGEARMAALEAELRHIIDTLAAVQARAERAPLR